MEIGEGEGRAERAGAVVDWFFKEEGEDKIDAWVEAVCMDTSVELSVR